MELLGLKHGLRDLELNNIQVHDLVTDRHVMIKLYMKKDRPSINHYFDVWHIAKGTVVYIKLRTFYSSVILYIYLCNVVSFLGISRKLENVEKNVELAKLGHGLKVLSTIPTGWLQAVETMGNLILRSGSQSATHYKRSHPRLRNLPRV